MTDRQILDSFRDDLGDIASPELNTLHEWLHIDESFADEAGPEFVLAVDSEHVVRRLAEVA